MEILATLLQLIQHKSTTFTLRPILRLDVSCSLLYILFTYNFGHFSGTLALSVQSRFVQLLFSLATKVFSIRNYMYNTIAVTGQRKHAYIHALYGGMHKIYSSSTYKRRGCTGSKMAKTCQYGYCPIGKFKLPQRGHSS